MEFPWSYGVVLANALHVPPLQYGTLATGERVRVRNGTGMTSRTTTAVNPSKSQVPKRLSDGIELDAPPDGHQLGRQV